MPVSLAVLLPSPCLQCVFVYAELFNSYCPCVCISICVCVRTCVCRKSSKTQMPPSPPQSSSSYLLASSFIRLKRILFTHTDTHTNMYTNTHFLLVFRASAFIFHRLMTLHELLQRVLLQHERTAP